MNELRRRDFITGIAMLPAASGSAHAETRSLRDIAASRNILFGSMVTLPDVEDPAYARLIADECAIITPGIEAKWRNTEAQDGVFRFGPMDAIAGFAVGAGLRLHMHNLIWSVGLPKWTLDALAQGRGREIMARHISQVAGRYRGRVHSWDVINEAVDPRWTSDRSGLVMTPWWHGLGPDFIVEAFADAAAADPAAQLMINDDDLEYDSPDRQQKRTLYLRLVESWLSRGVRLQAFGLETHLKPWLPIATKQYRQFLHELAGFGLKLRITEFDVNDRKLPPTIADRDRLVAAATRNFLDLALDEPALDTLIVWGLSDRATWMQNDPAGQRPDGLPPRPSPYDAHLAAKPMRDAIAGALHATRMRPA